MSSLCSHRITLSLGLLELGKRGCVLRSCVAQLLFESGHLVASIELRLPLAFEPRLELGQLRRGVTLLVGLRRAAEARNSGTDL